MKQRLHPAHWPIWIKTIGLVVAVGAIALAATGWFGVSVFRASLLDREQQRILGISRYIGARVDSLLEHHLKEVSLFAADRGIREAASAPTHYEVALAHLRAFDALQEYSGGIYIMDRQGQVILSTTDNLGQNFAFRPYFQRALQGETYASDVSVSLDLGRPVLYFSAPLVAGDGSVAGVVVLRILAEKLWDTVDLQGRLAGLGPESVVLVVDGYGIRLAHSQDRSLILRAIAPLEPAVERQLVAEHRLGPLEAVPATELPEIAAGINQARTTPLFTHRLVISPETYHAAATVLSTKSWTVVVSVPEPEFMRPVTVGLLGFGAILGLVTTVALSLIAYQFSRDLVRPVERLNTSAQRIAAGSLGEPIPDSRRDELGTLARSLEKMRLSIRQVIADLEETQAETIMMLARAAEAKDETTGDHLLRIHAYVRAVAERMGLPPQEAGAMAEASMLHDVGKLHVPDDILNKPGRLTEEEWMVMRQHPADGARILGSGPRFALAREIARGHHEHWDGSGYPDGLRGEEIALSARLTAVADMFDALTSNRPYRNAWPPEQALAELIAQKSKNLDPIVVDAFVALWEEGTIQGILVQHGPSSVRAAPPLGVS